VAPAHASGVDSASSPMAGAPTSRARLLIIDDEPLLIAALSRTLAPEHEVVALTHAHHALERLRAGERYELILCDLMMPEMPGHAERMVFLTGGAFTEAARTFLDTTRLPWLEKPFEPETLRTRLRALLAERATLTQLR